MQIDRADVGYGMISSLKELVRADTNNLASVLGTMQAITGYAMMKLEHDGVIGISVIELVGNLASGMPGIGRICGYIENKSNNHNNIDDMLLNIANNLKSGKQIDELGLEVLPKKQDKKYISYITKLLKKTSMVYLIPYKKLKGSVYVDYLSIFQNVRDENLKNDYGSNDENKNENIFYIDREGGVGDAGNNNSNFNSFDDLFK